jgi:hypothetical protein
MEPGRRQRHEVSGRRQRHEVSGAAPDDLFERLANELKLAIVRASASASTVTSLTQTSREWKALIMEHSEALWKPLAFDRFPRLAGVMAARTSDSEAVSSYVLYRRSLEAERSSIPDGDMRRALPLSAYILSVELHLDGELKAVASCSGKKRPLWDGGRSHFTVRLMESPPSWYVTGDWGERLRLSIYITRKADLRVIKLYEAHTSDRDDWETNWLGSLLPRFPASSDTEQLALDTLSWGNPDDLSTFGKFDVQIWVSRITFRPDGDYDVDDLHHQMATDEQVRYFLHTAPWPE